MSNHLKKTTGFARIGGGGGTYKAENEKRKIFVSTCKGKVTNLKMRITISSPVEVVGCR